MVIDIEMCLHCLSNDSLRCILAPHAAVLQCWATDNPRWCVKREHLIGSIRHIVPDSQNNNTQELILHGLHLMSAQRRSVAAGNYVSCFIWTRVFIIDWRRNIGKRLQTLKWNFISFSQWIGCCHKVSLKGLLTSLLSQSQNDISTINWKHENERARRTHSCVCQ